MTELERAPGWLARVAGVTARVSPRTYAVTGFGLMALKYVVEAAVLYSVGAGLYSPIAFLSPLLTIRANAAGNAADVLALPYLLWTLPFAWVGVSMTVRRFRDAGLPGWFGLVFFFPVVNFLVMLGLCVLPTRAAPVAVEPAKGPLAGEDRVIYAALTGVAAGTAVGMGAVVLSVYGLGDYGGALFLGAPMIMGTVAGFLLNVGERRSGLANIGVAVVTCGALGGLMLLTAMEGAICIAMAAPIGLVLTAMGVFLGRALAAAEGGRMVRLMGVGWPAVLVVSPPAGGAVREVESVIDIHAAPEAVWDAVVGFGGVELPPPPEWFFQLGIAYPVRARIEGVPRELGGAGATRYCEFSTGPFVEPIETWSPPVNGGVGHLAFSVTKSPPTMKEWSIYNKVHAPHLEGVLKSKHGEFVIEPLGNGVTRLTGRTWYTFEMDPEPYWGVYSDAAIHAIHGRVLRHIQGVAEAG